MPADASPARRDGQRHTPDIFGNADWWEAERDRYIPGSKTWLALDAKVKELRGHSETAAMDLLLRMVLRGNATVEYPVDGYFEFGGKAYDATDHDWNRVVTEIGWDRCRAAAGLEDTR